MSDYKPLTVVDDETACSVETLIDRIKNSREQNGALLQEYHNLWYESGHTWHYTHFLGIGLMKCPNDLWIYQDLVARLKPTVIIETGTYQGGSALWFAFLLDMMRIKDGRVFTVDIHDYRKSADVLHPKITYLEGNSADPELVGEITDMINDEGRRLIVLDSDHSAEHVYNELELYAPLARLGDYVVIEDTNISWTGGEPGSGDLGARGGVQKYMEEHPGEFVQDLLCERYLLTMNPGGWLIRVKECNHGEN